MSIHCSTNPAGGEEEEGNVLPAPLPRKTAQSPSPQPRPRATTGHAWGWRRLSWPWEFTSPRGALRASRLRGSNRVCAFYARSLGPQCWAV